MSNLRATRQTPAQNNGSARTERGEQTRQRIIEAAADLIFANGVARTTLDDVRAKTGTSKSQLYHYFEDKAALVRAVIERATDRVIDEQRPVIESLDTWEALYAWRDLFRSLHEGKRCHGGCAIGSLAASLAETDEQARQDLARSFIRWQSYLQQGLTTMRERGDLTADADPTHLAWSTIASLQGGLLLAQTTRDVSLLDMALDASLASIERYRSSPR